MTKDRGIVQHHVLRVLEIVFVRFCQVRVIVHLGSSVFLVTYPWVWWGRCEKKLSPEGGRKGGWRKKARAARPPGPGLEPGTCRVLGEGPQLHATGVV